MAKGKGKKNAIKTGKTPGENAENTATSQAETKENKPQTNTESVGKVQSVLQSLRSQGKPRSPLSDSSSMLIQEVNDSDATNPDLSKLKKAGGVWLVRVDGKMERAKHNTRLEENL
ncbi:hypothetical protein XENOCAPTIV_029067 [Xenoophorus captivus]|uniref:Uncharacterized protein n=1 Tax=Xenoophorus captivus TaxID=1517983 RepID=A0ABV0RVP0_9TELE